MFETCLILAGGRGSRLGKLTAKTPKPLVKVGETQFIYYLIEHLISHGISNIILLTGYKSEQFDSRNHIIRQEEVCLSDARQQMKIGIRFKGLQQY